ncbi:MAG: Mut7-C RNAse domain-containing protein [Halobacteriales archaeon]|nr:Mut7-C RNAse domain-containing protein [Halobacteriales archaeon]
MPGPEPLLCDAMLGKLARWLRLLGFDTAYPGGDAHDDTLAAQARAEQRVLLTRDVALAQRVPRSVLLRSKDPEAQLREALLALGAPDPALRLTRCTLCNEPLRPAKPEEQARAPPSVRDGVSAYRTCPSCGQLYWRGTHVAAIERALRGLDAMNGP